MSDVVVTVPKQMWSEWIAEGDLPGDDPSGAEYWFFLRGDIPDMEYGDRVYIVAHGKLRGYAPLVAIRADPDSSRFALIRNGNAVACTVDEPITGFRGWKYRWWMREDEKPFHEWRKP